MRHLNPIQLKQFHTVQQWLDVRHRTENRLFDVLADSQISGRVTDLQVRRAEISHGIAEGIFTAVLRDYVDSLKAST